MPLLARNMTKAAFLYFIAAFLLAALMLLDRWLSFSRWLKVVYVSQLHLLLVGWITQLAVGVAYWIFPRFLKEQDPRRGLRRPGLGRVPGLERRPAAAPGLRAVLPDGPPPLAGGPPGPVRPPSGRGGARLCLARLGPRPPHGTIEVS